MPDGDKSFFADGKKGIRVRSEGKNSAEGCQKSRLSER
jgi:hypothetical protein